MKDGKKMMRAFPQFDFGTTDNGSDYVLLTFSILEGPDAGETIDWRGFFTEKTQERTIESLRYCGWRGNDITDLSGIDTNVVQGVIEHESYEGKTYPRVKWVNRLGGGIKPEQQMDDQKRAAFAARMRGAVMAAPASLADGQKYDPAAFSGGGGGGSGGSNGAAPSGDPGFGDDDIPF